LSFSIAESLNRQTKAVNFGGKLKVTKAEVNYSLVKVDGLYGELVLCFLN